MKILDIINLIGEDKFDQAEVKYEANRRGFITKAGEFSWKAALAALPVAAAIMPKTVKAQTSTVNDVLNFALTLEYLEADFYQRGLAAGGLLAGNMRTVVAQISKHEDAHVAFLRTALGSAATNKPNFDFTANGLYPTVFSDANTFMLLAQTFEDVGVRAYKGQAPNLTSSDSTLTAALQIHSVEARHASMIRKLRGVRGWIRGNNAEGSPATAAYAGEENTTQLGRDISTLPNMGNSTSTIASEAFDEPLTRQQVLDLVTPFLD